MGHSCYFCFLYQGRIFGWYDFWGGPYCTIGKKLIAELHTMNNINLYSQLWLPFIQYIYYATYPGTNTLNNTKTCTHLF